MVIRLVPPFVPIVGAIGDNQEQAGILRGDDQLYQQTESKSVVPVKVLDDRDDRLHTGLAQQQPGDGRIGVLPMQDRVERPERMPAIERIEEIQQRGKRIL